jgi:hypothetical protein
LAEQPSAWNVAFWPPTGRPGCYSIQTFTMLGALAGIAGWLWMTGRTAPLRLLAGAIAITVSAHRRVPAERRHNGSLRTDCRGGRRPRRLGSIRLASSIIAIEVLCWWRRAACTLAAQVDDVDREANPLRRHGPRDPAAASGGPYGPFGVRPRALWAFVLFARV